MISLERTTGSHRLSWISLLGALLVPIMMAAGFLAATWNSSSRWDKVQAAIVNSDQPVKINGRTVPLGRQLASALVGGGDDAAGDHDRKRNFDWVISDPPDAAAGLADGRYVGVVTIPRDFSRAATSYSANKGTKAEHATLDVQTSKVSGVTDSAIAQAISRVAVSSLNDELTKQYLDNLYLGFNRTQQGIQKSADGASGLADGAGDLSTGIDRSATGAGKLATGLRRLSTGTGRLSDGIGQTDTGLGRLATGISGLHTGVKQTDTGVAELDTGVGELTDGTDTYASGASRYAKGVGKYTGGVDQYAAGVSQFVDGIGTAAAQVAATVSSKKQIAFACTAQHFTPDQCRIFAAGMTAGADGTATGIGQALVSSGDAGNPAPGERLKASGSTIAGSGDQLVQGADGLASGAKTIHKSLSRLHAGTGKLAAGTGKLAEAAKKLATGTQQLADGLGKLDDAGRQVATGTAQSASGARRLGDGLSRLADGGDQLADGVDRLATGLGKAADRIPTYSGSDREQLGSVVSAPVAGDQPTGLFANETTTTLLMALALWIGGLATYLIVRAIGSDAFGSQKSSVRLAVEGIAPGVIIGVVQATILSIMIGLLLDLPFGRTAELLGFAIFAATTFAVLNQALVAWLGGIGRFIATVVVVMAAAGALTNAVPGFFTTLRPYLPITPALDGVRMIVTDGPSAGGQIAVLLGWLVIGGLASVLAVARRRVAPALVPVGR